MKQTTALDVREFIDAQPFSGYQLLVAVICGTLVFMDGYDAQAMGFVGPALRAQLHIPLVSFGRAVSIGLVGMMIGGLVSLILSVATPIPAHVPLGSIVAALLVAALTGVVFGLYPAVRASRLDPVKALHYE